MGVRGVRESGSQGVRGSGGQRRWVTVASWTGWHSSGRIYMGYYKHSGVQRDARAPHGQSDLAAKSVRVNCCHSTRGAAMRAAVDK